MNSISDKYLSLTSFFGICCPRCENIDKFLLEGISLPSSCLGMLLIFVLN
jgi:hypothetical protein